LQRLGDVDAGEHAPFLVQTRLEQDADVDVA